MQALAASQGLPTRAQLASALAEAAPGGPLDPPLRSAGELSSMTMAASSPPSPKVAINGYSAGHRALTNALSPSWRNACQICSANGRLDASRPEPINALIGSGVADAGCGQQQDLTGTIVGEPGAWERLRELAAAMSVLPEAFEEEESSLEQMTLGSDREIGRRLARLNDRLSTMALWHQQKA